MGVDPMSFSSDNRIAEFHILQNYVKIRNSILRIFAEFRKTVEFHKNMEFRMLRNFVSLWNSVHTEFREKYEIP